MPRSRNEKGITNNMLNSEHVPKLSCKLRAIIACMIYFDLSTTKYKNIKTAKEAFLSTDIFLSSHIKISVFNRIHNFFFV